MEPCTKEPRAPASTMQVCTTQWEVRSNQVLVKMSEGCVKEEIQHAQLLAPWASISQRKIKTRHTWMSSVRWRIRPSLSLACRLLPLHWLHTTMRWERAMCQSTRRWEEPASQAPMTCSNLIQKEEIKKQIKMEERKVNRSIYQRNRF